jgi:large subunit ribosomal protein L24
MAHVRKGDEVIVLTGKDAGKRGKVLLVDPRKGRVKVEKIALIKKHVKPSQKNPQGGIVEKEGTIHISNVRLWDSKAGAPTSVTMKRLEDGRKVRVSKKTGEIFDQK